MVERAGMKYFRSMMIISCSMIVTAHAVLKLVNDAASQLVYVQAALVDGIGPGTMIRRVSDY